MPKAKEKKEGLLDTWGRANRKLSDIKCNNCGNLFRPKCNTSTYCSRKCFFKSKKGKQSKLKNTGKGWINGSGYDSIKIDGKTYLKHRIIMELHIGRKLLPKEAVHHINGIKTDNRIENLQIMSFG